MSAQSLQNLSENTNYFRETSSIRKLILINFTENIIIKTTVWENKFETKVKLTVCDFLTIKISLDSNL